MLDADISTEDAKRLLSTSRPARPTCSGPTRHLFGVDDPHPDDVPGPSGWSRRRFLQAVGAGVGGGAAMGALDFGGLDLPFIPDDVRDAYAATPIAANEGVLINIVLYGGNDSLNTVVPFTNGLYYQQHGGLAVPAGQVLPITGQLGLHPNLPYLKSIFDQGNLAIVQGVGYANPDLSHFTSMAIWMHARYSGSPSTGWLGRWLDGLPADRAELAIATIDSSVALHMIGANRRAVGVSPWGDLFGADTEPQDTRMYDGIKACATTSGGRGQWHDMFARTMRTNLDVARDVAPVFGAGLPEDDDFVRKMTIAARLVNANVGLRVVDVGLDGFDTHDDQLGNHPGLLRSLDNGIQAFYATLAPQWQGRVTLMTMSEFGRTSHANGSGGTDHGTAADMFVFGSKVRGGLYGLAPTLSGVDRWERLEHHVDFRHVIGSVLDGWLGGGGSDILGGGFENLGLFEDPPGGTTPTIVLPPAARSGFVPLAPLRIFDTRDGTGGRSWPLGAQESWSFRVTERFGVPADAVAVAINVTSVDATANTFLTVHPKGEARPFASNLNPEPGVVKPNLVIARIGLDGSFTIYNNSGTVHLVGDLAGYFVPSSDVGYEPLTPARLLDTRDGTGDRLGALGPGESIDLQVTGRGGVSGSCVAVALNVTAVEPSAPSYLTAWPTGETRPLAASVNMAAGQTVPNMVLVKVGAGGKVSLYNNSGAAHVVVDVLGCFGSGVASKFVTISPVRVLDTRDGTGAPQARVGTSPLGVPLAGRLGIPANGVTAVLLNVTAVTPSWPTYVTVYPNGVQRPLAANLNAMAGTVVGNMVIARLGTDGAAAIYNNTGDVDLVADAMGYFST
jgi:uncharacterized protein (DUF1501 family)